MLQVKNFTVQLDKKIIVNDISFILRRGESVVLMGPNGSGKSTLASTLMGHPTYTVSPESRIVLDGANITTLEPHKRAQRGLFLAFQNPIAIPGVSVTKLLREVGVFQHGSVEESLKQLENFTHELSFSKSLLSRGLNDGFSGGEKKKVEMVQASFMAKKYAIFDEIDTGLDIDALKKVAHNINHLRARNIGCLIITHYQRLVEFLTVDRVLVMAQGRLVAEGKKALVRTIEKGGYQAVIKK